MTEEWQQSVLVVDDDQDVLRLVVTILRRLHLTVFPASGADEALRIFKSLPTPPDLLLTDVTMPGTTGPELAEQILRISPEVRVLFMSGFDNRLIPDGSGARPDFPLLPKPFTFDNLGVKVKEVLSSGRQQLQLHV